jgi:peroxiredoxin Q/BCP
MEGQNFRDLHAGFQKLDCEIYGISRDSIKSHEAFKARMKFPFDLLSDEEEQACKLYGVIKMKTMYGRKVRGIERSTFAIDARGIVRREWRGVRVPGHAQEVLEFMKTLR